MVLNNTKCSFVEFAKFRGHNKDMDYLETYKKDTTEGLAFEIAFRKFTFA